MILRCWPLLIIVASWVWGISLWLRLADYQTEHPGEPYMWNWKFLNPNNFTADGQPILYRLWASEAVFALGAVLAMLFCV